MSEEICLLMRETVFKEFLSGNPVRFGNIKIQLEAGDWKRKAELFKEAVLDDCLPVWGSNGAVEIYEAIKEHQRKKHHGKDTNG